MSEPEAQAENLPLADLPIRVAADLDKNDEIAYLVAFGPVLAAFPQITPDAYWNLTVAEHASLMRVLEGSDG